MCGGPSLGSSIATVDISFTQRVDRVDDDQSFPEDSLRTDPSGSSIPGLLRTNGPKPLNFKVQIIGL